MSSTSSTTSRKSNRACPVAAFISVSHALLPSFSFLLPLSPFSLWFLSLFSCSSSYPLCFLHCLPIPSILFLFLPSFISITLASLFHLTPPLLILAFFPFLLFFFSHLSMHHLPLISLQSSPPFLPRWHFTTYPPSPTPPLGSLPPLHPLTS